MSHASSKPDSAAQNKLPLLHFFEVWEDLRGSLHTRNGILPYAKVEEWLHLQGEYSVRSNDSLLLDRDMIVRLIGCDFHRHPFALGCGYSIFHSIKSTFRLHESSQQAILNNNGAFARYFRYTPGSLDVESFALVFKVANGIHIGYDALSMAYSVKEKTTRAFIHGFFDHETERLISYLQTRRDKSLYELPLLIAARIFDRYREKTEAYRVSVDDSLHVTQARVGYAVPGMLHDKLPRKYRGSPLMSSRGLDFEGIARQFHSCATELGTIIHAGTFGKELGMFLRRTAQELDDLMYSPSDIQLSNSRTLVHQIEFTVNLYTSLLSQATVLRERANNHINLTFSLIAQDENRISRSVAEESARIAKATKRDSATMKSIAVLTMVFLPPTFVATFFSMNMFKWIPDVDVMSTTVASKYLWVYWVVTIPLTATVLIVWRIWSNKNVMPENNVDTSNERVTGAKDATDLDTSETGFLTTRELMADFSEAQRDQLRPYRRGPFTLPRTEESAA